MRAAVTTTYGPPEVVRVVEVADPVPGDGEMVVRVHATTVNRTDCGYRAARPFFIRAFSGLRRPKATILGCEFAGEVVDLGPGADGFAAGDRVFGYVEGRFGAHAEYLTVPADGSVTTIPTGMSFVEAAPGTEGSHYALADIRGAGITAGQDVMVYGATGAIGSAAVQILAHLGARVTATCATPHVELVEGLGADRVIDHTTDDVTADTQRYDVVFDAVGKRSYGEMRVLLKPTGVYLSTDLGPFPTNPVLALVTRVSRGTRVLFPVPKDGREVVEELRAMMETGAFRPVIDRTYPLDEIVEAYRYVETGEKLGNVVIAIAT